MPSPQVSRKTEALEKLSQAVPGEHVRLPVSPSVEAVPESPGGENHRAPGGATMWCPSVPRHPQLGPLENCRIRARPSHQQDNGMQSHICLASVQSRGSRLGSCLHLCSVHSPGPSARALPGAPGAEQPQLPLPSEKALTHAALGTGTWTFAFWDLR